MAATADQVREVRNIHTAVCASQPVAATTVLYQGTAIGLNGAVARALVAGDKFLGLAREKVDNSAGAAAALNVPVESGLEVKLAVTDADGAAHVGALVYASADDTFTLTAGGNSPCGVVTEWITGTTNWVKILTLAEIAAL